MRPALRTKIRKPTSLSRAINRAGKLLGSALDRLAPAAPWVALGTAVIVLFNTLAYLVYPGYYDHVEPAVATLSWQYDQGQALYPSWSRGEDLYSLPYGPILFQLTAVAMALSPTIAMSKLFGILAFLSALAATWWALNSIRPAVPFAAKLSIAGVLLFAACFVNVAYWNRPEAYLLLLVSLALLVFQRLTGIKLAFALGLLAGIASAFKLAGFLFIAPFVLALLGEERTWTRRAAVIAICAGSAGAAFLVPFADHRVSLADFGAYMAMMAQHGLHFSSVLKNASVSLLFAVPLVLVPWRHERGPSPDQRWLGAGYGLCLVIVAVLALKPGGGPYYLVPFLPLFAYLTVLGISLRSAQSERRLASWFFVALALILGPSFLMQEIHKTISLTQSSREQAWISELKELYELFPDAAMGLGDAESYPKTYYHVVGTFAGGPVRLDYQTWTSLKLSGVSPELIEQLVSGCAVPHWILPSGASPFSMMDFYQAEPLMGSAFRRIFLTEYIPTYEGSNYTVWGCRIAG